MRCYLVSTESNGNKSKRYAGTNADAKTTRDDFVARLAVKKKDVDIEQVEVPADKNGLLEFINGLCSEGDIHPGAE